MNDEEYCLERGACFPNTKICRYCYNWTCRKDAREEAKRICKTFKNESHKKTCDKKKRTGRWLDPATRGKRKRKKNSAIKSSDNRSKGKSNSKTKKKVKSKFRSLRRRRQKTTKKTTPSTSLPTILLNHLKDLNQEIDSAGNIDIVNDMTKFLATKKRNE